MSTPLPNVQTEVQTDVQTSDPDLQHFTLTRLPADFYDDPYRYYAALRKHRPVHWMAPNSVLLTRYDDVLSIYRHPQASSDKKREFLPKFGPTPLYEHHTTSLVFNDPPLHTRVRKIIMGALTQRAITRMEHDVKQLVSGLIDAIEQPLRDGQTIDFIESFAAAIPVEVIGNLLSFPHADRRPLRGWSLAILAALEPQPTEVMLSVGNQAVRDFLAYLRDLVADRRAHPLDPAEDVLTRLIQGERQEDGSIEQLSELELLHNCVFLLNAGHETTTNLLGNGWYTLMRFADQQQRLRDNPSLIPSAVEECLRYESPLQLNNRQMLVDVDVGGQTIAAGSFVTLCIGAANRDPSQFTDPDRFDVGRKPNKHVGFGHAAHACSGMNVARMEGRVALEGLTQRLPALTFGGDPVRDRRARFRGFRELPVRVA